jgi:hypothetical protein
LKGQDPAERAFSMFVIRRAPEVFRSWRRLDSNGSTLLPGLNGLYFNDVRRDLREFNYKRALEANHEARLFIFTYEEGYQELFRRFGLDAFYCNGPSLVINVMPDLIQLLVERLATTELARARGIEVTEEGLSDAAMLISAIVDKIVHEKQVRAPPNYVVGSSADIADYAVRSLYGLASHVKKPNVDLIVKALLALALSLDIAEVVRLSADKDQTISTGKMSPGSTQKAMASAARKKDDDRFRLSEFMPRVSMNRMLDALMPHPLSSLIRDWNAYKVHFAGPDHPTGVSGVAKH